MKPYQPRPITFLGVESLGEWRIKLYTLRTADSEPLPRSLIESAFPVLKSHLEGEREPCFVAGTDWGDLESYLVGFAMIHVGTDAVFLLCDFWVGENMINHSVWVSALTSEPAWQSIQKSGTSVCVWELAVQSHERNAWIKHVYNEAALPDIEGYLADGLTASL